MRKLGFGSPTIKNPNLQQPNQAQKKPKNKSGQHPTQAPSKQGKHNLGCD